MKLQRLKLNNFQGIKALELNFPDGCSATIYGDNATGKTTVVLDGVNEEIAMEDLLIDAAQVEGYESISDHGYTVVLDTNLTPELIEEGFVREVISKVQTMRKEAGFEVMDKISVYVTGNDKLAKIMEDNKDEILHDVMATTLTVGKTSGYTKDWNINGEDVTLAVEKN